MMSARVLHLDSCRCYRCCETNPRLRRREQLFVIDIEIGPRARVPWGYREVRPLPTRDEVIAATKLAARVRLP